MTIRLGEILINRGLLSEEQVESILDEQSVSQRPFGLLAEAMCGLTPRR